MSISAILESYRSMYNSRDAYESQDGIGRHEFEIEDLYFEYEPFFGEFTDIFIINSSYHDNKYSVGKTNKQYVNELTEELLKSLPKQPKFFDLYKNEGIYLNLKVEVDVIEITKNNEYGRIDYDIDFSVMQIDLIDPESGKNIQLPESLQNKLLNLLNEYITQTVYDRVTNY